MEAGRAVQGLGLLPPSPAVPAEYLTELIYPKPRPFTKQNFRSKVIATRTNSWLMNNKRKNLKCAISNNSLQIECGIFHVLYYFI
jgi:hypothetical protein